MDTWCFIVTIILWICLCKESLMLSDEKKLIKILLEQYDEVGKVGRPVLNTSHTVNVKYGLALIQILDLDEKNQVLTTNTWNRFQWIDALLTWEPDEYGGIEIVRIPTAHIWTPDIVLYNYADYRLKEQREAMAVVTYDGTVMWIPMAIYKSTCQIDIKNFPFDEQTCHLKFGSWTYDGFKLDLNFYNEKNVTDITDYVDSNEWKLLEHPAVKNTKYYPCCKEPYPDLTFTLKIKRIAAFYSYILILPCVLLATLTLVVFWLPPESPAKMILGMNILMAFFLLLLTLADSTPPAAASIPLIGAYFCLNMVLITCSTFLSVIVINLYFRGDKKGRVPAWIRACFIDGIGRVLCMTTPAERRDQTRSLEAVQTSDGGVANHIYKDKKGRSKERRLPELKYNKFEPPEPYDFLNHGGNSKSGARSPLHTQAIESDIREIRRCLRTFMTRVHEKEIQGKISMEWRTVALIMDRIFFFTYLAITIISLATIFPKS
ncbi:unnamed protein product [Owenia fusiformis]|uniref:Uncharacterized protein n=1 Tax=Owenia fusiformis TaxID=6347 RepID=A0A8J1U6B9_OWEFU|nr:unnamed protein product [Owenia fusiformis]